ncbi:MAG: C25 family cysteine peptidase, partial [Planctomycetota bacterium]
MKAGTEKPKTYRLVVGLLFLTNVVVAASEPLTVSVADGKLPCKVGRMKEDGVWNIPYRCKFVAFPGYLHGCQYIVMNEGDTGRWFDAGPISVSQACWLYAAVRNPSYGQKHFWPAEGWEILDEVLQCICPRSRSWSGPEPNSVIDCVLMRKRIPAGPVDFSTQAQKTNDVIWIFRELSASEAAERVKGGKEEPSKWKFTEPHKGQWEKHAGYNPSRIVKRQTIDHDRKKTYVIITTSAIKAASGELADFVAHKKSRGFNVKVITEKDFGGGVSDTAADNIRGWLQKHYLTENIKYVLLVGDPRPETGQIPMKMIWTHPHCKEPIPSDYYYADLTGNWDWNADGRYGMWPGDFGPGGVDQYYEVLVGRIPYYGSIKDLDAILRKTINYENQSGDAIQWRKNALLVLPHKKPVEYFQGIKDRFLEPAGWECHRVCDYNYGLDPPPETIPCTMENTIKVWKNGKFGLMLSWGHGRSCSAAGAMDSDHVGE